MKCFVHNLLRTDERLEEYLQSYKYVVCNMSLKFHFLDSRLHFLPSNLSDEHAERFYQQISVMWHGGVQEWSHCCWTLKRDTPDTKQKENNDYHVSGKVNSAMHA